MTLNCETQTSSANDLNLQYGTSHSGTVFSSIGELAGNNTTGKPSFGYDRGGQQISRDDRKWDGDAFGSSANVTYSYLSNSQAENGYQQLTSAQMRTTERAMDMWSAVANIDFKPASGGSNISNKGDITFQGYDGGGGGWASWGLRGGGATDQITGAVIALGGNNLSLSLHEVGHAIGLSHPGDYNGGGNSYEKDAEFYQDSEQYSVMSYWSGSKTGAVLSGATGPGLYDISAIQRLYGANEYTYTSNTVYGFNSNTQDGGWTLSGQNDWIQAAIWDAGGNDTIDMSGYSEDAKIDLREESFSSTGGLKHNLAIAKGAVIENAIGGSGDDVLLGNLVSNELKGGRGDDTLFGKAGADVLSGGGGFDRVFGGSQNDIIKSGAGNDLVFAQNGNDLMFTQAGNDSVFGGVGNDSINLGDGNDTAFGGAGIDTITGARGNDTLSGGGSGDTFIFAANQGDDRITDYTGADTLDISSFGVNNSSGSSQEWRDATISVGPSGGGRNVTIAWDGGGTLVLENTIVANLTDSDFAF